MWKGIDVSDNQGVIDWAKVKAAGVQFAILRSVRRSGKTDYQFAANLAGCRTQGIPVEVYKYTYATSQQEAMEEAQQVVALLQSYGLQGTRVWWDVEDRLTQQPLGRAALTACIKAAQAVIEAAEYQFGIYTGLYVYNEKWFGFDQFAEVPLWVARYPEDDRTHTLEENPPEEKKPDIGREICGWQWSSKGNMPGIKGYVDLDIFFNQKEKKKEMTEAQVRQKIVNTATAWLGCKESNGTHKPIIDLYNTYKPLPRRYKVKYTDSWCATFCSAVAIAAGYADIIPLECSCGNLIALFKARGRWVENDAYIPAPGDFIFYDWDDSGKGDCTGWPDHVGIVTEVSGSSIRVIEGNKNDAVDYRTISVNARYIRGYGTPDYASKATVTAEVPAAPAKQRTVTANILNIRKEPTASSEDIGDLIKGSIITVDRSENGWAHFEGWASEKFLK